MTGADTVVVEGPLVDGTALLGDHQARRSFLAEHGYLFLPGALDVDRVARLRSEVVGGMIAQGVVTRDGGEGLVDLAARDEVDEDALHEAVDYDALWHAHRNLFEIVLEGPAHIFRATTIRFAVPHEQSYTAPAHQDGAYVPHDFYTVWAPLVPVTADMGGIALSDGSHRAGVREHVVDDDQLSYSVRTPLIHVPVDRVDHPWCRSDYAPGDAVIFDHHLVHTGLPNLSADGQVRLSVDTRFQPADAPRSLLSTLRTPELKRHADAVAAERPAPTRPAQG